MKLFFLLVLSFSLSFSMVDINNASVSKLKKLKGVGVTKAYLIKAYRKKHCFKKIDDLLKIKGIGKKFLDKNKDLIKIGKCHLKDTKSKK